MMTLDSDLQVHPAEKVFADLSNEMGRLLAEAGSDVRNIKGFRRDDPLLVFKVLTILFLCKAIETGQGIMAVLEHDLTLWRLAVAMTRSILELYINARYMKTDPVKLAERYCRYGCVRQHWLIKEIGDLSDDIGKKLTVKADKAREVEDEYIRFKKDYHSDTLWHWHGLRNKHLLEAIRTDAKEEIWLYRFIFRFQSNYIHNEIACVEEQFRNTEGGFAAERNATAEDIDRTMVTVIVLFAALYDLCSDALSLNKSEWIEGLLSKFKARTA